MAFKPYCEECASWHDADAPHVASEKRQRPDRWKDCPSTHCERSHECRSPSECAAKSHEQSEKDSK